MTDFLTNASDLSFAISSFVALGIERLLYGYCYICTDHFKVSCRSGVFGKEIQNEDLYWKCMQKLGMYVKVFQFSVVLYDLLIRDENLILTELFSSNLKILQFGIGLFLVFIGQVLNYSVFRALGAKGVYYGYEFGYPVARVSCFPYNLKISDPQYWGVVICVWGVYVALGASSYLVPILETFWYLMSMQVFEHSRGRRLAQKICANGKEK